MFEHGAVHALGVAAAHLVPVVPCQLKLGRDRQAKLRHRGQVVEPGFAGHFLLQEPAHLVHAGLLCEPGEQGVLLAGSVLLQGLEPGDEAVGVLRGAGGAFRDLRAPGFEPVAFPDLQRGLLIELPLPVIGREPWGEAGGVEGREPAVPAVIGGSMGRQETIRHQRFILVQFLRIARQTAAMRSAWA